jgi:Zn-finger nucleic acid-binding protein
MQTYRCPRCDDVELQAFDDPSGVQVWFCARCRGTLCAGTAVVAWLGAELSAVLERAEPSPLEQLVPEPVLFKRLRCPSDGQWLGLAPSRQSEDGIRRCEHCEALFLDAGVLPKLRASALRVRLPTLPPASLPQAFAQPAESEAEPELLGAARRSLAQVAQSAQDILRPEVDEAPALEAQRVPFSNPWVDLLALPLALVWMAIVATNDLGRMLLYTVQIQFHEFGHAVPAWLSGRAALPLPFGFTFWREERSLFVGLVLASLIGVLIQRGRREGKRFFVLVGATLLALQVLCSLLLSEQTSMMLMILGGIAGELLLSSFVIIAFYFPLLDRLRWDFFRFVLLFPAAGGWLATSVLWIRVKLGVQDLPMGSILGTAGDGSGDLERLVDGYGFSRASITTLYLTLVWLTALALLVTYGFFAGRACRTLREGGQGSG